VKKSAKENYPKKKLIGNFKKWKSF